MKASIFEELKTNLKKHSGVIGKERFYISGILIPIIELLGEYHLLFQKRAKHIRQGGEVSFPGGLFDPDNDLNCKDTAIRETIEEIGIDAEKIEYIDKLGDYVAPMGVFIEAYVGILKINDLDLLDINHDEVEKVFTVPIKYFIENEPKKYEALVEVKPSYFDENGDEVVLLPFKKLGLPQRYSKPWGRKKHRVFVYDTEEIIWGITAEIVQEFAKTFPKIGEK